MLWVVLCVLLAMRAGSEVVGFRRCAIVVSNSGSDQVDGKYAWIPQQNEHTNVWYSGARKMFLYWTASPDRDYWNIGPTAGSPQCFNALSVSSLLSPVTSDPKLQGKWMVWNTTKDTVDPACPNFGGTSHIASKMTLFEDCPRPVQDTLAPTPQPTPFVIRGPTPSPTPLACPEVSLTGEAGQAGGCLGTYRAMTRQQTAAALGAAAEDQWVRSEANPREGEGTRERGRRLGVTGGALSVQHPNIHAGQEAAAAAAAALKAAEARSAAEETRYGPSNSESEPGAGGQPTRRQQGGGVSLRARLRTQEGHRLEQALHMQLRADSDDGQQRGAGAGEEADRSRRQVLVPSRRRAVYRNVSPFFGAQVGAGAVAGWPLHAACVMLAGRHLVRMPPPLSAPTPPLPFQPHLGPAVCLPFQSDSTVLVLHPRPNTTLPVLPHTPPLPLLPTIEHLIFL